MAHTVCAAQNIGMDAETQAAPREGYWNDVPFSGSSVSGAKQSQTDPLGWYFTYISIARMLHDSSH